MSDDIDGFYEFAKNNFANFLKKNNVQHTNENEETKQARLHMQQLKAEEENDREHYDEKYKKYIVGNKKKDKYYKKEKHKRTYKSRSSSSSSSASSSSTEKNEKKRKHKESRRKNKEHTQTKKEQTIDIIKEYDEERSKYKKREKEKKKEERYREEKKRKIDLDQSSSSNSVLNKNPKQEDEPFTHRQPNTKTPKESKQMEVLYPENNKLRKKVEEMIKEKKHDILLKNALNKNVVDCKYCIDSHNFNKMNKLNVISISRRSYICYYNYKQIFLKDQLFISTMEHTTSITNAHFETVKDIRNHMKSLIAKLETTNETCIFVEFNNCFNRNVEHVFMRKSKHTYINCYVIPNNLLEKAKSYFKKNLEDVNSLYRENKQLIISKEKYAPYNLVPKNIPYISINFGLVEVYIQIIENNYDYINMCTCIFTDLFKQDKLFKYFKSFDQYVNRVEQFKKEYIEYDWTNYIKNS